MFYVVSVRYIYIYIYSNVWFQCKTSECLVSFKFLEFFFFFYNIYLVTTLLMTILTFTWRKNKNNVQEIKEKYNVTAFTTK